MTSSRRLSTVILPIRRWNDGGRSLWVRAEELGFHAAYTYDHLSWRTFRDGPWFGAVPTLTAAAAATERLRLGTLVTSPNFRHPVTLAKDLITLDDVSDGRITLGIGAGGNGFDATTLRGSDEEPWTPRERADHFDEFVPLLDRLLREPSVTQEGRFYAAHEARNIPGCVQRPRLPFAVAATGPRGLRLAARYGQAWVTTGDPKLYETGTPAAVRRSRARADQPARCGLRGDRPGRLGAGQDPADRFHPGPARCGPSTRSWTSRARTSTSDSPRSSSTGRCRTPTSPWRPSCSSGSPPRLSAQLG